MITLLLRGLVLAFSAYKALKNAKKVLPPLVKAGQQIIKSNAAKKAQQAGNAFSKTTKGCKQGCPKAGQARAKANKAAQPAKRATSKRDQYLGRTPGKNSRTGREVQARMRSDGTLRDNVFTRKPEFKASDGKWYPLEKGDMAHKPTDAVKWWNEVGRQQGAKSSSARDWMLDSKNYTFELKSINRSAGAKLPDRYLPPLK